MATAKATVDLSGVEKLTEALEQYGAEAQKVIAEYLRDDAFDAIGPCITRLLPVSGRTFQGHPMGARAAGYRTTFMVSDVATNSVTVKATPQYQYLYFPDDGSNTKRHRGKQQFMVRGAEAASPDIVDTICTRLVQKFEEV
ncbi:MAG: hypothetical protein LUC39_01710 [Clostridiales bacterium]|nr:hypothetical protein [Clostridiales bacterium]